MQGWRNTMEDEHLAIIDFYKPIETTANSEDSQYSLFAVFDGHGGRDVAQLAKQNLPSILANSPEWRSGDIRSALSAAFLSLDSILDRNRFSSIGSTAVVAVLQTTSTSRKIFLANAGDSRAVLCKRGVASLLTTDHKPGLPDEKQRIEKAGGRVVNGRVNMSLNLSRCLGDFSYKDPLLAPDRQIISAVPDVFEIELSDEDEFLVLGCDGVWELQSIQQVCDFIKAELGSERRLSDVVGDLLEAACSPNIKQASGLGLDNLTGVLVYFRPGLPLLPDSPEKPMVNGAQVSSSSSDEEDREFDA